MDGFFDWKGWSWAGWGVVGILAPIVIAVWPKRKSPAQNPPPAPAFGLKDYQEGLETREARLRADLGRAHGAEKEILARERDAAALKLADVESAYAAMLGELEAARAAMSAAAAPAPAPDGGPGTQADAERRRLAFERAKAAINPVFEAAHRRGGAEDGRIDWSDPAIRAEFDAAYGREPQNEDYLSGAAVLAAVLDDESGAEGLWRRVLALQAARGAQDSERDRLQALRSLADLLRERDADEEAEEVLRRLIAAQEKALGPEAPDLAHDLNTLAVALHGRGGIREAEALYRRALALEEKAHGPEAVAVEQTAENLAVLLEQEDRLDEAEALLRRCVAITGRDGDGEHYSHASNLHRLANLLAARGAQGPSAEEAGFLYRRALAVTGRIFGPDAPETQEIRADSDRFISARP